MAKETRPDGGSAEFQLGSAVAEHLRRRAELYRAEAAFLDDPRPESRDYYGRMMRTNEKSRRALRRCADRLTADEREGLFETVEEAERQIRLGVREQQDLRLRGQETGVKSGQDSKPGGSARAA